MHPSLLLREHAAEAQRGFGAAPPRTSRLLGSFSDVLGSERRSWESEHVDSVHRDCLAVCLESGGIT